MNNNLPTECLVLIIDHTQDLPTLHSLLTVNWVFFRIAARAIYRDPIHLAWSQDIAVRKSLSSPNSVTPRYLQALFDFILQVSPAAAATATSIIDGGDDNDLGVMYLRRMRNLEQWQQDKITIDYLGFIEVFDFPSPAGMRVDPILCHPSTKIIQTKYLLDDMQMKGLIKHTITWAACCHHFETLRRMYIPVCKLNVYLTVIPRLTRLATITFDHTAEDCGYALWEIRNEARANDSNRQIATTDDNYNSTYVDNRVGTSRVSPNNPSHDFVRAFINHHTANNPSSSPLQDCRIHKHQFWSDDTLEESIQDILPPLRQPWELAPHNWYRFIKVADTVDLSRVEAIERSRMPWNEPWFDFQQVWPNMSIGSVLQRCRCLQALEMDHVDEVGLLRWGVEGREKKEEEQQDIIKDERAISQRPLKAPSPSLALLPPLRRLDITCKVRVFEQLINDALIGFGPTLEKVKVKSQFRAQSVFQRPIRLGPNRTAVAAAAGGGEGRSKREATRRSWHLPNLRKLVLECRNSPILLEPSALNRCPLIEELVIEGKRTLSPLSSEDGQEQPPYEKLIPVLDTWQMIQLRKLSLNGPVAWSFCPKSLQSMASLTTLLLVTAGGEWATDQSHQSQQSQHDDHHQQLPTPLGDVTMNLEEEIRRWGPIWNSLRLPHLKKAEFIGDIAGVIDVATFLRCCPKLFQLILNANPPDQHPGQGVPLLLPLRMQTDFLPAPADSLQKKGTVVAGSTVALSGHCPKAIRLNLFFKGFHISDDQVDHIPLLDKLIMDGHFELEKLNLSSNSGFSSMRLLQACERSDVLMDVMAATTPLSDADAKLVGVEARDRQFGDFGLTRPNGRRFCWYQFGDETYIRNRMP